MTFQECIDDALVLTKAYNSFASLTDAEKTLLVSEAINELQKKTRVVKATYSVATSTLDANGTAPLDPSITIPTRCYYTPVGTTGRIEVITRSGDEIAVMKLTVNNVLQLPVVVAPPQKLYVGIEQNRILFWPYQGLNGTFNFTAYAKLPRFVASRSTDPNSVWFGWDTPTNINAKLKATLLPQEFDDAEAGIVAYVAAGLIATIPGWKNKFRSDYEEWMRKFWDVCDAIVADQPTYPSNYISKPNYGW